MKLKDNSSTFLIKFLFGLLVIAFLFGIYIFLNLDTNVKEGIITSLSDIKTSILEPQNFIINHIIILCVLFVLSLSVFGSILVIFYNFYEIASLGFFIASMIKYKGIFGLLFGTGIFICNKLVWFLIISYLCIISITYSISFIQKLHTDKSMLIIKHIKRLSILLGIALINETLIYFLSNKILSLLLFLL